MRNQSIIFRLAVVLAVIGLLSGSVLSQAIEIPQKDKSSCIHLEKKPSTGLPIAVEPAINIRSDADFLLYSFPGDGSAINPYRIEDTTYPSIRVENVSKYVIIQNCTLTSDARAIRIGKTAPDSIVICNNTMVDDINLIFDFDIGIFVSNSSGIIIKDNIIIGYDDGIDFNSSPNCLIDGNIISKSDNSGIRIENNAPYATISNNTIFDCDMAMNLENANSLVIENNHCFDNYAGIILSSTSDVISSSNCIIRYNLIENHQYYGAIITGFFEQDFSSNNLVYLNTFVNNNPNGTSQAKDIGANNLWYDVDTRQGNYWSDWYGLKKYAIDGSAESSDKYPLKSPYHLDVPSTHNYLVGPLIITSVVFILSIVTIGLAVLYQKNQKKRNIAKNTAEKTEIKNGEIQ